MRSQVTIPASKKFRIIIAFSAIVILLGAGIYSYYVFESRSLQAAAAQNIQAIADLKINQIIQWRKERIANARTTFRSPSLVGALHEWTIHPDNAAVKKEIIDRLNLIKHEYNFADIFLAAPDGAIILSLDGTRNKLGPQGRSFLANARNSGDVFERDFFISSIDGRIYYDIITSVRKNTGEVIGYFTFRTDPHDYLYPLIRRWPTPSGSSETILVRKDGDSVLYLNDLRFLENTALKFRIPLTRTDLPAVQAVLGKQGIFDGNDYRGVHTLAYLAPIPNTPWVMVTKIDYSEILAELTYRSVMIIIFFIVLTLLLGALAALLYRSHEKRMYDAVLANEEKYKILFMHAHDALFIVDDRGRIIDVNPSGCAMLGYAHNELIGRPMNDLYYGTYPAKDVSDVDRAQDAEPLLEERLMIRKDGTHVPVEFSRTMMPDGKMQKIIRNITERKEMEQILRDIQRRQAVEVLSSGMAHDFNNLLAVMMGNVSLAQAQLPAGHPVQKYMGQTLTALERAAELIKQILAYSGKGKFQEHDVDLTAEIQTYLSHVQTTMPHNVELATDLPSQPIFVKGDPDQIRQILVNLVSNARDAVGERQGTVTIALSSVHLGEAELYQYGKATGAGLAEGDYVLLEVRDTGSGIGQETLNHIFDPFYTTKFIGRGLGLSAVLGIVRGHEGGIAVETTPGQGSAFKIILPVSRHVEAAQPRALAAPPSYEKRPATVLLIDDEDMVAEATKDLLESEKYTVITELDPRRAIEVYKTRKAEIGVVIVDWMMPEMSGGEVAKALHAIDPNAVIIISSGYSEQEIKKKIDGAHVTAFLQKPYSLSSLKAMLQRVMK